MTNYRQIVRDRLTLDCGDSSCRFSFAEKGGMRTNGGCRCFERRGAYTPVEKYAVAATQVIRELLDELDKK